MPHWYEIKPTSLKRRIKHKWLFAAYAETPSEREDHSWYEAFLFRNQERTIFGIREGMEHVHHDDLRKMATKVILDVDFRNSLISDDPRLPQMWKRH
jgi:hypothetical protein